MAKVDRRLLLAEGTTHPSQKVQVAPRYSQQVEVVEASRPLQRVETLLQTGPMEFG